MSRFYVNRNSQDNGNNEVHQEAICTHPPEPENRKHLGEFDDCRDAVRAAKRLYSNANGCAHCAPICHTA